MVFTLLTHSQTLSPIQECLTHTIYGWWLCPSCGFTFSTKLLCALDASLPSSIKWRWIYSNVIAQWLAIAVLAILADDIEEKHMQVLESSAGRTSASVSWWEGRLVVQRSGWWRSVRLMIAFGKLIGLTWVPTCWPYHTPTEWNWIILKCERWDTSLTDDADEDEHEQLDVEADAIHNLHIAL